MTSEEPLHALRTWRADVSGARLKPRGRAPQWGSEADRLDLDALTASR